MADPGGTTTSTFAVAGSAPPTPRGTLPWRGLLESWIGENELLLDAIGVALVILLCFASYFIAKRGVLRGLTFLVKKSRSQWDDIILSRGVFARLAWLAPAVVIYYSAYVFSAETEALIQRLLFAYMLTIFVLVGSSLLTAINDIYTSSAERAKQVPIKGYLQVGKIALFVVGGIVIFAIALDRSPWGFLSGIGAMTAILLLVFKDTILSFVASIQLASNDMVRLGDWISMPQFGADGDVVDIALHTVKVQNWDKTITSIPTHALIEGSFKNWRGMQESGGRRIKRAIHVDLGSIRFLDDAIYEKLSKVQLLKDYLESKKNEVEEFNRAHQIDPESMINGRRLTNIGTFRAYLVQYLKSNPKIHSSMTFLVRQLEPGPTGLPIEIYVFSNDTNWVAYEGIQADIFDHIMAALPEFGLRVFQNPTGHDFARFATA